MKKVFLFVSVSLFLAACNSGGNQQAEMAQVRQHTIDSLRAIDSVKAAEVKKREAAIRREREENRVAGAETGPIPAQPKKKKGWSNTAKGAVIGAGVGAVTGAVVDKKSSATGAVIGGLAGAGVGAATGAVIDHKKKQHAASGQ